MECCGSISMSSITEALAMVVKNKGTSSHVSANVGCSNSSRKSTTTLRFTKAFQGLGTAESFRRLHYRKRNQQLFYVVANGGGSRGFATPFEASSQEGKLLGSILKKPNQRHLFEFALSEQLDDLVSQREQVAELKSQSAGSMEAVLNRRIAEMKEKECQGAVEDIMYMSIAHMFLEVDLPMVGNLSDWNGDNTILDESPSKCKELESIHSHEVQEMVKDHLVKILSMRERSAVKGLSTTKIDKHHMGRIYAASIMFGYFLKSACFRRQMNSRLTRPQKDLQTVAHGANHSATEQYRSRQESLEMQYKVVYQEAPRDTRHENLKSYVEGLDSETLQRCAKLKSKEAVNVINKQTWALFGDEKICENDSDNKMVITFSSLERLVLEAVGFGSFLWDVERSVDSIFTLAKN